MSRPKNADFGTIWQSLAESLFALRATATPAASHSERALLFRNCVQEAFYNLLLELCEKPLRVSYRGEPTRALSVDFASLQTLIPALPNTGSLEPELSQALRSEIIAWIERTTIAPEDIGYAFERLYGRAPDQSLGASLRPTRERNTKGVFFTPSELVEELCDVALDPILNECTTVAAVAQLAVVDPAMGAGRFLLDVAAHVAARVQTLAGYNDATDPDAIAISAIYGVDRDPLAVDVARFGLWLAGGARPALAQTLRDQLRQGDALTGPAEAKQRRTKAKTSSNEDLDWSGTFPRVFGRDRPGFDLVLGNPPWGKIRSEYKRFLSAFFEEVRELQGAELRHRMASHGVERVRLESAAVWDDHAAEVKDYVRRLKVRFGVADGVDGRGDADLYKYFMARCFRLSRSGGSVALIVPAAFRNTEGAEALRSLYLEAGRFIYFSEKTNGSRYFPIHPMFRFVSFAFVKGAANGIERMTFAHGKKQSEAVAFDLADLRAVGGPDLLIPEVRSAAEAALLRRLYKAHPALGAPGDWTVRFVREVDMTNASARFVNATQRNSAGEAKALLPLYEGRMVGQFDYAAKEYIGGAGRTAEWRRLPQGQKRLRPHYYLPVNVRDPAMARYAKPRAAFCDITGHANRRTVLATIVPGGVACGNKVPTCRFEPHDDPRLHLLWVALANSLVVDWLVRRRISTTLNFFHWYAIPFPRLDPSSKAAGRLIDRAAALVAIEEENAPLRYWLQSASTWNGELLTSDSERRRAVDEIDADVASLYGLDGLDLNLIRDDFKHLRQEAGGSAVGEEGAIFASHPKAA